MPVPNIPNLPDNYIYISHLPLDEKDKYFIIPNYPDSIQDSLGSNFAQTTALSRSAPVWTYVNSGPRQMQITLRLTRDLLDEANIQNDSVVPALGEDYIDELLRALQAIAVPKYNLENKLVEPPLVAIRFSEEIFIKGIVTGGVTVTYAKPVLTHGKYSQITVSFQVYEVDPYDATTVFKNGGFRGLVRGMREGMNYLPDSTDSGSGTGLGG